MSGRSALFVDQFLGYFAVSYIEEVNTANPPRPLLNASL